MSNMKKIFHWGMAINFMLFSIIVFLLLGITKSSPVNLSLTSESVGSKPVIINIQKNGECYIDGQMVQRTSQYLEKVLQENRCWIWK